MAGTVFATLQVIGVLLLGAFFLSGLDFSALAVLRRPQAAGWLGAALGIYALGQVLNGFSWRHLLNRLGAKVTLRAMVLHDLSSVFWCSVLPGGLAGEVVKGVRLAREVDAGTVAVCIACARLSGGAMACALALAAMPWAGLEGGWRSLAWGTLGATCAVGLGGLGALWLGPGVLPKRLADRLPVGQFPAGRDVLLALALGLLTHGVFALVFVACFAAGGAQLSLSNAAVVSALTSVAQVFPFTLGGLGVRELTVVKLGQLLLLTAAADAAAVAVGLTFTAFIILGGAVELARSLWRA